MLIEDAILKNIEKIQEQDCCPTITCIVLAFVILLYVLLRNPPPFFFTHMLMYTCIVMLCTCIIRLLTLLFIASIQFVPHSAILYIYMYMGNWFE